MFLTVKNYPVKRLNSDVHYRYQIWLTIFLYLHRKDKKMWEIPKMERLVNELIQQDRVIDGTYNKERIKDFTHFTGYLYNNIESKDLPDWIIEGRLVIGELFAVLNKLEYFSLIHEQLMTSGILRLYFTGALWPRYKYKIYPSIERYLRICGRNDLIDKLQSKLEYLQASDPFAVNLLDEVLQEQLLFLSLPNRINNYEALKSLIPYDNNYDNSYKGTSSNMASTSYSSSLAGLIKDREIDQTKFCQSLYISATINNKNESMAYGGIFLFYRSQKLLFSRNFVAMQGISNSPERYITKLLC